MKQPFPPEARWPRFHWSGLDRNVGVLGSVFGILAYVLPPESIDSTLRWIFVVCACASSLIIVPIAQFGLACISGIGTRIANYQSMVEQLTSQIDDLSVRLERERLIYSVVHNTIMSLKSNLAEYAIIGIDLREDEEFLIVSRRPKSRSLPSGRVILVINR